MPGPQIEAFPAQSSAIPHPRALRMPTKRPAQEDCRLRECDACRRHSPLRFASNGDVGTPVSKCSLKEDYRIPALAQRTLILVRMSHRQSGQNQWLRCPVGVCAVKRRRFPVGASPARQPLQPEATGAVMEETKWLKPSVSVSRIGDSASVQAVTRANAEQASKRTMRRPTRQPFRGRLIRLG